MTHHAPDSLPAGLFSPKELKAIQALGARSLDDLLRIPPRRYRTPGPLRGLRFLEEGEEVSILATVVQATARRMKNRKGQLLDVRIMDEEGEQLSLTFFLFREHLVSWHMSRLREDVRVLVSGTVTLYRGQAQISHPEYLVLSNQAEADAEDLIREALKPAPVYPLRQKATQKAMRQLFAKALTHVNSASEPVPHQIRIGRELPSAREAIRMLHAPETPEDTARAQHYFRFEEAFVIQSVFARRRAQDAQETAPALSEYGALSQGLDERLPFALTESQKSVGEEIASRICAHHPSSILLQGDVGSGKTVVALRAMTRAVDSGYQAALLAPTEVLARQHFDTLTSMLGDLGRAGTLDAHPNATAIRLLVGSQKTSERRQTLLDLMNGNAGIVVGTHALLTESVEFFKLGLVIVDEQHRFGVDHRRQLRAKGPKDQRPHMMVMTATPIPRSAALTVIGDLDSLILSQRPRIATQVQGFVVPLGDAAWQDRMWKRTREEISQGRQAFVVCPRIDLAEHAAPSTGDEPGNTAPALHTVVDTVAMLAANPDFAGLRIAALHGQMPADEKQQTMEQFATGHIDLLVSTTVIEVGVDVPNASVMVVLDAERFGLAQLHQLRGRIGRGEHASIAFFATDFPRGSEQHAQLEELASTTDGFALAELDLSRRGSGDLVGEVQSGSGVAVRFLDVQRDSTLILDAREDALVVEALRSTVLTRSTIQPPTEGEIAALDRAIEHRISGGADSLERS